MRKSVICLLVAVLCAAVCLPALAEGNVFRFEKEPNFVFAGESIQLALVMEGAPAGGEVTFSSKREAVAQVDEKGLVTGVAKGQTAITAVSKTDERTYTTQIQITVGKKAEYLELDTSRLPVFAPDDELISGLLSKGEAAEENENQDSSDPEKQEKGESMESSDSENQEKGKSGKSSDSEKTEDEELKVLLLPVKKTLNLNATVMPRDATNRKVKLSSSDETVFTVRQTSVTGAAPGEAVLTIYNELSPEVNLRFRVLVVQPVKKINVTASEPSVTVGKEISLTAAAEPSDASIPRVTWSADEKYVSVDQNGVVKGLQRGTGRIVAAAVDGSNVRANFSVRVVQNPTEVTLKDESVTLDVGKSYIVRATVLPANADDKKVNWVSSDESVAKVGRDGRITAVSIGECQVTAACNADSSLTASVTVHVQQPVTRIAFTAKEAFAYEGETTQLSWVVEPATATNPKVAFSSSNTRVVTVDENGLVTGVGAGNASIIMESTDGSRRKTHIPVKVGLHVTGVEMVRKKAYLDKGETQTAGANIFPKNASNKNMTWTSSDESIVTATGNTNAKMRLKGIGYGNATVTGVTEDGNYETSIEVLVSDFTRYVRLLDFDYDNQWDKNFWVYVRNDTDVVITSITLTLSLSDKDGAGDCSIPINTKDNSNTVKMVWYGTLNPGETTGKSRWKMVDYRAPDIDLNRTYKLITLESYQIDNDWIKYLPEPRRPKLERQ